MRKSSNRADTGVKIPTSQDFDPFGGCLDAQSAWRNFGDLSITDSVIRAAREPYSLSGAFHVYGRPRLRFLLSGLDIYIREFRLTENGPESEAAYAGKCVAMQFRWKTAEHLIPILPAILTLADYVCLHSHLIAADSDEQRRIIRDWQTVYKALDSVAE